MLLDDLEKAPIDCRLHFQQSHVSVDEHLITGQNPASAAGVAQAILKAIQV